MTDANMQSIHDRLAIAETVMNVGIFADRGDMAALRRCFADEVEVDYSALRPDDHVGAVKADDLMALWLQRWQGVVTMHHLLSNIVPTIDGDEANCVASIIATHHRQRAGAAGYILWQLGAYYDYRLVRHDGRWVVTSTRITRLWERTEDAPPPVAS